MIEGLGTYGSIRPIPASKKHLVIHLLDQLVVHRDYLRSMQDCYFDSVGEYNYALCYGIATVLSRNYHINAFAAGGFGKPNVEFTTELYSMYERICSEHQLNRSIMDATGTLDLEVQLSIRGFHLYAEIVTFPFHPMPAAQVDPSALAFAKEFLAAASQSTIQRLITNHATRHPR
jgi:hypothetical protein